MTPIRLQLLIHLQHVEHPGFSLGDSQYYHMHSAVNGGVTFWPHECRINGLINMPAGSRFVLVGMQRVQNYDF